MAATKIADMYANIKKRLDDIEAEKFGNKNVLPPVYDLDKLDPNLFQTLEEATGVYNANQLCPTCGLSITQIYNKYACTTFYTQPTGCILPPHKKMRYDTVADRYTIVERK